MNQANIKTIVVMLFIIVVLVTVADKYVFPSHPLSSFFKSLFTRQVQVTEESQEKLSDVQKLILDGNCYQVLAETGPYLEANPKDSSIWHMQGVCQFDLGKFAEAKASFQKVLSLDSGNVAAKNYLKNLEIGNNGIMVTSKEMPFDRTEYERLLGTTFSSSVLRFEKVIEQKSNIPKYLLATYTRVGNLTNTVNYLEQALAKVIENVDVSEVDGKTIVVGGSQSEMIVVTLDGSSSSVTVNYQKLMP